MRLNRYLNEKLDLNYKLKGSNTYDLRDSYEIEFDVNGLEYTFGAEKYFLRDSEGMKAELGYDFSYDKDVEIWNIAFRQDSMITKPNTGQYEVTGEQGIKAMEVFSALATCMKQFLAAKRPEYFSFSAQERSRLKLYARFAKMITKISGKYTMKSFNHKSNKYFLFIRN